MIEIKKSAMGSSKYEFEPEQFDKDVADKMRTMDNFKLELKELMLRKIKYSDGIAMGEMARRTCIIQAVRDIFEEKGWNR